MLRGTKRLTYQQPRWESARLQASLGPECGFAGGRGRARGGPPAAGAGSLTFSIQAERETVPSVLELLRQVLREPALPADEFEVIKRQRLAGMEQMRTEPAMLAPRMLQRELTHYSKENIRYVPTIEESLERLRHVTHQQVVE